MSTRTYTAPVESTATALGPSRRGNPSFVWVRDPSDDLASFTISPRLSLVTKTSPAAFAATAYGPKTPVSPITVCVVEPAATSRTWLPRLSAR
jgi:hypothetical protein